MKIPLTKPAWGKAEEKAVIHALRNTIGTGDGPNTAKLEKLMKKLTGSRHVFAVTSCTHGLELAARAIGIKAGDEVIVPSFTLSSTANAVVLAGAKTVFADIEPDSYSIDPKSILKKISKKTKAIIIVHYAGMPAKIEEIIKIAKKYKLWVIEDAAHCLGSYYKGKMLGTWGDIGVFSLHGTKNISCGEGGILVTNNDKLADFMDIFRACGTNRKAYLQGLVSLYSWVGVGSSYYLSDLLAAIINPQLKRIREINSQRTKVAQFYQKKLELYTDLINLPKLPADLEPNWHIFAIKFKKIPDRNLFMKQMHLKGIGVSSHYVPLHQSPMGKKISGLVKLPVTEDVAQTLVRLPIYPGLAKRELEFIMTQAKIVLEKIRKG
jgi:dTDP-4-amino-4,6-dideoxygalactose transaminase